jgi:NAD(P)-dependent dehydrogenase (short-subunit alcohol dehydrogenase family)
MTMLTITGGIAALPHGMAISLATHRLRVPRIAPGGIETGDIAQACQFLTESADFMTGQHIILDGGMSVKMIYV